LGNIEFGDRPLTPTLSHRERELSGVLDWLVLLRNVTIKRKGEVLAEESANSIGPFIGRGSYPEFLIGSYCFGT